jgi:hypothetical protein
MGPPPPPPHTHTAAAAACATSPRKPAPAQTRAHGQAHPAGHRSRVHASRTRWFLAPPRASTRLLMARQRLATISATLVDPTKVTPAMSGWSQMAFTTSAWPFTICAAHHRGPRQDHRSSPCSPCRRAGRMHARARARVCASRVHTQTWNTPFGMPTSFMRRARTEAAPGTFSDGFRITLPRGSGRGEGVPCVKRRGTGRRVCG